MRISSNQFFQTGLYSINSQQSGLMQLYRQIGSGQRMVTPADDPLAASQAVNLGQAKSLNERFSANRSVARRSLDMAENTLSSMTSLLQNIKTRLIEAGNEALSDQDRATLSNVLSGARASLLGLANASDGNGQYLFSGSLSDMAPFQEEEGRIVYKGDDYRRDIQADPTRLISSSDIGCDILERAAPGDTGYVTQAAPGNTGTGVVGSPIITDPQAATARCYFTITFTGAGTYQVRMRDVDDADLGMIENQYFSPGRENKITLPHGVQVTLSGSPVAGDEFSVEPLNESGTKLNLFDTLDNVISALETPSAGNAQAKARLRNVLTSAIQRINSNYDNVLIVRASVGTRLNELDALDESASQMGMGYAIQLSNLEDLDFYSASTQLQLRLSALEAASLAFKRVQSISLFNLNPK